MRTRRELLICSLSLAIVTPAFVKCSGESESRFTRNSNSPNNGESADDGRSWLGQPYFQSVESQYVHVEREIYCKNISLQRVNKRENITKNHALNALFYLFNAMGFC